MESSWRDMRPAPHKPYLGGSWADRREHAKLRGFDLLQVHKVSAHSHRHLTCMRSAR